MAHVAQWKFAEVESLTKLLTESKVVGIAEIGGIPAPQMQQMRSGLREHATIRSAKNNLLLLALDEAEKKTPGIAQLKEHITGQAAIIATDMNPFKLFSQIKGTRTMAPAKGGETAAHDIIVKAGDTPFKPGPVVGELQKVGIPAAIQEGKVVVKNNKVIVPKGEKISVDVAQMLTRLEIYPIEIGITLHSAFEEGNVLLPEVLDIDLDSFVTQVHQASSNAFGLALETGWVTPLTIQPLVQKAFRETFAVALETGILTKETAPHLLAKAYRSMVSVASSCSSDALSEDLKKQIS